MEGIERTLTSTSSFLSSGLEVALPATTSPTTTNLCYRGPPAREALTTTDYSGELTGICPEDGSVLPSQAGEREPKESSDAIGGEGPMWPQLLAGAVGSHWGGSLA